MHLRTIAVSVFAAVSLVAGSSCLGDLTFDRGERSYSELELRNQQRAAWVDLSTWSHSYAISELKNLGDESVAYERLLQSATELGNSFQPLYGSDAQPQLSRLFRQRVAIQRELVLAVEAGDTNDFNEAKASLDRNAERIADALNLTNPNLGEADMLAMLKGQNEHFIMLVDSIQRDDWNADVVHYDAKIDDALKLADALVVGFRTAFPERIRVTVIVETSDGRVVGSGTSGDADVVVEGDTGDVEGEVELTEADLALHLAMRELYSDHAMYEKFFVMSAVGQIGGQEAFATRLLKNADETAAKLAAEIVAAHPDQQVNPENLQRLMRQHVILTAQVVNAAMALDACLNEGTTTRSSASYGEEGGRDDSGEHDDSGDQVDTSGDAVIEARRAYNAAVRELRDNADAIASVLAEDNDHFAFGELRTMLRTHVDQTVEMIQARIDENWAADVAVYDRMAPHMYEIADFFSEGIIQLRLNQDEDQTPSDPNRCPSSGSNTATCY